MHVPGPPVEAAIALSVVFVAAEIIHGRQGKIGREIKARQAIMGRLRALPVTTKGELPAIPVDARAAEVRAIKAG